MSNDSSIEWTNATWNPTAGCTRASPGCDNCYAVPMTYRLEMMGQAKYAGLTVLNPAGDRHFNGVVRTVEAALAIPLGWKKPRRIFVNSMSDLFHKDVPLQFQTDVFEVMAKCPQHTFQILTKRADHLYKLNEIGTGVAYRLGKESAPNFWPLPNVWIGVSVEDQERADERIPHLLQCPAAVRFLSVEPMLGPIDLRLGDSEGLPTKSEPFRERQWLLHWVIVGGESGPKARPMHPDWARSTRDQCVAAGVAFFFKQWGAWAPRLDHPEIVVTGDNWGTLNRDGDWFAQTTPWNGRQGDASDSGEYVMLHLGKKIAGRLLDGREWNEFPSALAEAPR